jgi:type II secretory pathway component PulF
MNLFLVLTIALVVMAFFVPHFAALWQATEPELTGWQARLASMSQWCVAHGWAMMAVLLPCLALSLVWRVVAQVRCWRRIEKTETSSSKKSGVH